MQDPTLWPEVELAVKTGYYQHRSTSLAPYFLGLEADAFIAQNKMTDALEAIKESLKSYALRLAGGINQSVPFAIIGLSFGGMLATEMATVLHPQRTVLVSSVPTKQQLPWYYRLCGMIKLNKLTPSFVISFKEYPSMEVILLFTYKISCETTSNM